MARGITTLAHLITICGGVLGLLSISSAITRSALGENAIGDLVFACTVVIVPYCIAGSMHRLVMLFRDPKATPPQVN
jgi:phosphatidylserine synthase